MWGTRLLFLLLVLPPSVAEADVTATYSAPGGQKVMKIEVAENGDLRSETFPGTRVIYLRDGTSFVVDRHFSPPMVARVDDLAPAVFELLARADPTALEQAKHVPHRVFVRKGTVSVQGRTGDAYYEQAPDGRVSANPAIVISHDPALAPLGRAIAAQFEEGEKLSPSPPNIATRAILRTGTPLLINGLQLQSISDAAIPPSEFELPGPIETSEGIRNQLAQLAR